MNPDTIQRRRWLILSVLVICLLVVILDNTILNVALRTIQGDLDASQSQMQWAVDSYALVFAGLLITMGVAGDRFGRKKVLFLGMTAFGLTSALCSFANSPTTLILFRALMGVGAAAVQPQTLSIIQNVFEPRERPKAIGIWAGASGMAIALGPIAGGALLKYFWWGSVFLVNVPIVLIGVIAIFFLIPESRDPHPQRVDPFGVLLSIVALVVLVYGVIEGGNSNDWLSWKSTGAILLGLVLLGLFVYLEKRSTHPTIDVTLFTNKHFAAGSFALAMTFFALMGSTFYLAYFLQAVRGYTPLAAGCALIAVAAAVMIASVLAPRLSSRFGPRLVTGFGLTLFGCAMISYAFSTETMPQWAIELAMFAMGAGMGLTMTPATNAIMSAVPREKAGAGSAVNNTVRQVAGALGVAVLGSLLAVSFRTHLGSSTPADLATQLDQPTAIVSTLPESAQVTPLVRKDASESIGGALEFAGSAGEALKNRAQLAGSAPADVAELKQHDESLIGTFVAETKSAFVDAMHFASLFAGLAGLVGAVVAFLFFPSRSEFAEHRSVPSRDAEPVVAH
ncbi:drug resistance transporter, EmrB/QacA subfamily [Frankineae bacterium MT45]|nr:drug resistance transporter, EmrB/QacA subfamily [Frankineae bacterium MT45]